MSLPHSEGCLDSVSQDLSACVLNTGMILDSCSCSSQLSVTIPESWTDHTACQTHRRPQTTPHDVISPQTSLKSVMAAKKESVAKCAGPLQYGVGRPDGANTMIKTVQYLAEADNSRVLVAFDLKAAFQHVSRRAMPCSIAQTDAALLRSSPSGTPAHGAQDALRLCQHQN